MSKTRFYSLCKQNSFKINKTVFDDDTYNEGGRGSENVDIKGTWMEEVNEILTDRMERGNKQIKL